MRPSGASRRRCLADLPLPCDYRQEPPGVRRPANALNVEWMGGSARCRFANGLAEARMLQDFRHAQALRESRPELYLPRCEPGRCPRLRGLDE